MLIGSIFSFLENSVISELANAILQAFTAMFSAILDLVGSVSSVQLGDTLFNSLFADTFEIALVITFGLALIELGSAAFHHDMGRLLKVPVKVLTMVVGTGVAVVVINELIVGTDAVCRGLLAVSGTNLKTGATTATALATSMVAQSPFLFILAGLVFLLGGVGILLTLALRAVMMVVCGVFAPIALSGLVATSTRAWPRRWLEMTLALIFSKIVIVLLVMIGIDLMMGMSTSLASYPIVGLLGGGGVFCIAAFAPMIAMKALHFTGGHLENAMATGKQGLSAAAKPVKVGTEIAAGVATGGATAAAGAAGAGVGAAAGSKIGAKGVAAASDNGAKSLSDLKSAMGGAAAATGASAATPHSIGRRAAVHGADVMGMNKTAAFLNLPRASGPAPSVGAEQRTAPAASGSAETVVETATGTNVSGVGDTTAQPSVTSGREHLPPQYARLDEIGAAGSSDAGASSVAGPAPQVTPPRSGPEHLPAQYRRPSRMSSGSTPAASPFPSTPASGKPSSGGESAEPPRTPPKPFDNQEGSL